MEQGFDPNFGMNLLQMGASNQSKTTEVAQPNQPMYKTVGYESPLMQNDAISGNYQYGAQPDMQNTRTELDMLQERAIIDAMAKANSPQGGRPGVGKMWGQAGGSGVGAAIGGYVGGPQGAQAGAAIGGGAGGSIGTLIDWYNEKSAMERAKNKELRLKRKLLKKQKRKEATRVLNERTGKLRGIALTREEEARNSEDILRMQRENALNNMLADLKRKDEYDDYNRESFLKKRRMI